MLDIEIWSGGQTGVDMGALDAALELGCMVGGWCPKGRRSDYGKVPSKYPLREYPDESRGAHEQANVLGSDGTLLIARVPATDDALAIMKLARERDRPMLLIDPTCIHHGTPQRIRDWIAKHRIRRLNVAGIRESESPGIAAITEGLLYATLSGDQGDALPLKVSAPRTRTRRRKRSHRPGNRLRR